MILLPCADFSVDDAAGVVRHRPAAPRQVLPAPAHFFADHSGVPAEGPLGAADGDRIHGRVLKRHPGSEGQPRGTGEHCCEFMVVETWFVLPTRVEGRHFACTVLGGSVSLDWIHSIMLQLLIWLHRLVARTVSTFGASKDCTLKLHQSEELHFVSWTMQVAHDTYHILSVSQAPLELVTSPCSSRYFCTN
jgi:hypothetical protein